MRPQACDVRRLDLFLRNRLAEEFHRDIESHLDVCPACRDKLDELAGGPHWWSEVRQHLGDDGGSVIEGMSRVGKAPRSRVDLSFLQRSEKTSSLGRLGPYEVLEVIGQGGMGVVLKAFDPTLHRPVAIKVLAAEFAANGAARKRFAREAQAAAAVVHDHVVAVHAVDADATPPYLVMAFISGRSLQQRIEQTGPLELKEILRIGMQTASGLAAAHAQGLVHRDIKPANIMLENGIERVRITDFGLARAVDDASVTQHGTVAGTPEYMAPEQARADSVDQRADLFSLGSLMYAMCTGQSPFRGDSTMAVMRQVCDAEALPIRSLNPDVPAWLDGIIRKLHAKEPANRFQSAGEVAILLEECLAHVQQPDQHPLPIAAADLGRELSDPKRRRFAGWPALIAVAAAIVIGLTVLFVALHYRTESGIGTTTEESIEASAESSHSLPAAAVADDEFNREVIEVRARLLEMQQSISIAADNDGEHTVNVIRGRVYSLERRLNGETEANSEYVDREVAKIRQRLESLKKNLSGHPN